MLQAGRGAGKTRTGAEDAVEHCLRNPEYRYAVVAPTIAAARDVAIEGESGVLFVLHEMGLQGDGADFNWNKSLGQLIFANGSRIDTYSSVKPDELRGPQHHRAWCEELASWKDAHKGDTWNTTYNNLMFGLRLGDYPQHLITTTPRRVALIRQLADSPDIAITRGSTYDNLENLAPVFQAQILQYEGSNIGRQEIFGEILDEVEGALWTADLLEAHRIADVPELGRTVVAVDPPGGATEAGIVVAAVTKGACVCDHRHEDLPHILILDDASLRPTSPAAWGEAAVDAYDRWEADRIVGEVNYGGDMVDHVVRGVRRNVSYKPVRAAKGKHRRAEPVAALYEQGRVHHVGSFPTLESELTTWVEEDAWSPNRLDALVWAVTEFNPWKKRREGTMDLTTGLGG
jgi:phage terminase large subunit-like protein